MDDKDKDIIRPAGGDVMKYLNSGDAICNKCGAVMDCKADPGGGWFVYTCPACGWEIDEEDYEYKDDGMELVTDERGDEWLIPKMPKAPPGCMACGGPFPDCYPGCKMFDD